MDASEKNFEASIEASLLRDPQGVPNLLGHANNCSEKAPLSRGASSGLERLAAHNLFQLANRVFRFLTA